MAETTPLVTCNAFQGNSTPLRLHLNNSSLHRHRAAPSHHANNITSNNTSTHNIKHIPIRFVVNGHSAQTVPTATKSSVPTGTNRVVVGLSSSHVSESKVPLARRVTSATLPVRPAPTQPGSPRVVRLKVPLSDNPPPYEQVFNVTTEERNEPIECPSVLAGCGQRKEKKRSLRSRLLRHITGKKAAAQAARGSRMTSGSRQSQKNPASSPVVGPQANLTQLVIQQLPDDNNGNVQFVHNGSGRQLHQHVPNDSRFLNMQQHASFQLPTLIPQNNFVIRASHLLNQNEIPIDQTVKQVVRLHSVPEEDSNESIEQSSVNLKSKTAVNTSTSTQSATSFVNNIDITQSATSFVNNIDITSSNASQSSKPSSRHSSVFMPNHTSTEQSSPLQSRKHDFHKSTHQWAQSKVPDSQSTNPNLISPKVEVTSDKGKFNAPFKTCQNETRPRMPSTSPTPSNTNNINQKQTKSRVNKTGVRREPQLNVEHSQDNSYTINLKPGMYKLNLNFPGKTKGAQTQTINITVPSADTKQCKLSIGKPPPVPEELYYENRSKISLPQRFVDLLKPSGLGSRTCNKPTPKVTIIQQHPNSDGSQLITVVSPGEKHHQVIQQDTTTTKVHKRGLGERCPTRSHKKDRHRLAERKKAEGNEAYRNKEYRDALLHYSQAIELCPECAAYYSNRSACYMMLGKYREALNDAQRAVALDKAFVKGWLRIGKCHVALGDGGAAVSVLRQAQELEPNNTALIQEIACAQSLQSCVEECNKAVEKKDFRTAVFHLDQALRYALGGLELRIAKAEYLTFLGRITDAEDIVNEILVADNNHADALFVRGLCRYYQDNQDAAFQHFQKVLRLVPDHSKAKDTYKRAKSLIQKKEQGNSAFKMGDFARAMEIYTEALEIDERNKSTNSKLYCNRATVAAKLGKLEQAISDCSAAIALDDGYVKAYLRRANTYQQTEQYEEAVRDLEKVYRIQKTQEHRRMLQEAKAQLKRSKRKDYYKILGVAKSASDDEIKKAYRKMALLHHPDRHSSATAAEKAEHEKKFKELGEAYAVLTDPKKRSMHDRGQDVNDPECSGYSREAAFDPNQVFEAFFGPNYFESQSQHYYGGQEQPQQQFQGQFQGQHGAFPGFPGNMQGAGGGAGFQFGF